MPYHHGNLRDALIDAAVELAAADGPDAVALREVARRVDVSHNAAYRHFADRDELMRAVAARAMTRFGELMARRVVEAGDYAPPDDPIETAYIRLAASGRSYVEFAVEHTGLFRTACLFPMGTIQPDTDVAHPYAQLSHLLDGLVDAGAITPDRRANAEVAACSAVHGLAMLWLDGTFAATGDDPAARDRDLTEVLRVVRFGI